MSVDPMSALAQVDHRGRAYLKVGTTRVYVDGHRVGMMYPVPDAGRCCDHTPAPHNVGEEWQLLLNQPWVVDHPVRPQPRRRRRGGGRHRGR